MGDIAIKIEDISKLYQLGTVSTQTMYGDLHRWWARVRGKEDPFMKVGTANTLNKRDGDFVWALKDINLEIKQGDVVGIIGKNGAGKSTLLKILSRVTAPTTGQITVNGRIASLLEVGTGFHPELTGRENIFLNGAILGMTKAEIRSKFDEIVDFAGVEKYIDTPVKRYSSGMYVRLAFAVAAHLEPEILIVDEVLAVGDAEFQKKALGKMQDISKGQGRTVLFVSHNMGAVKNLCLNGLLLKSGMITNTGSINDVVNDYLTIDNSSLEYISKSDKNVCVQKAIILVDDKSTNTIRQKENFKLKVTVRLNDKPVGLCLTVALQNITKNRIFSVDYTFQDVKNLNDNIILEFDFPMLPYAPGQYSIILGLHIPNNISFEIIEDILPFTIIDDGSDLSKYKDFTGDMIVKNSWKIIGND